MRNKETNETYLVVLFTIYHKDYVNEDGTLKDGAADSLLDQCKSPTPEDDGEHNEADAIKAASDKFGPKISTNSDDVD